MEAGQGLPLVHLHGAGGLRLTPGARSPVPPLPRDGLRDARLRSVAREHPDAEHARAGSRPWPGRSRSSASTRFNLMGTSFGGKTALWLALQRRSASSPWCSRPRRRSVRTAPNRRRARPRRWRAGSTRTPSGLPPIPSPDPAIRAKTQALVQRLRGPDRDADLESRLPGLATPTLVLFGTLDRVIAPAMGRVYKELMPELPPGVRLRCGRTPSAPIGRRRSPRWWPISSSATRPSSSAARRR